MCGTIQSCGEFRKSHKNASTIFTTVSAVNKLKFVVYDRFTAIRTQIETKEVGGYLQTAFGPIVYHHFFVCTTCWLLVKVEIS